MGALESIRSEIVDFAGYGSEAQRRKADEQVRAFVGQVLAEVPDADVDALAPAERDTYDRVLLRCEFMNQQAFAKFEYDATDRQIAAVSDADAALLRAAQTKDLAALQEALDRRDSAMRTG